MVELDRGKRLPLYLQLADALRERLNANEFSPGEALPDQRSLSHDLGVNPRTVARALDLLEVEGLIYKIRGSGAFVGQRSHRQAAHLDGGGREIVCLSVPDTLWRHGTRVSAEGAAEYLEEAGYAVLWVGFVSEPERRQRWERYLHMISGTIAWHAPATPADRLIAVSRRHGLPVVAVGSEIPPSNFDTVDVDIRGTVVAAVRQMLASGCREVFGVVDDRMSCERTAGYREALAAAGQPLRLCPFHRHASQRALRSDRSLRQHGVAAARRILAQAQRPFGVFCANDLLAVGVYEALREAGLRVPEDARVIGCGDDPELHECYAPEPPPISAIAIPRRDHGRLAAEILVQRLAEPERPIQHRFVSTTICHRRTTIAPGE